MIYKNKKLYMEVKGTIKLSDGKIVTKPLDGESGSIKVWEESEFITNESSFIVYNGLKYRLASNKEVLIKDPS